MWKPEGAILLEREYRPQGAVPLQEPEEEPGSLVGQAAIAAEQPAEQNFGRQMGLLAGFEPGVEPRRKRVVSRAVEKPAEPTAGVMETLKDEWGHPVAVGKKIPITGGIVGMYEMADILKAAKRLEGGFDYSKPVTVRPDFGRQMGLTAGFQTPQERKPIQFSRQGDEKIVGDYIKRISKDRTFWGKVAQGVSVLPTWMLEFMLTGGLASMADDTVKAAGMKVLGNYAKTKAGKAALKSMGWAGGAITRSTVGLVPRVGERAFQRQVKVRLLEEGQEGWATSFAKAWGDVTIEAASETAGEAITGGLGAVARKTKLGRKFVQLLQNSWSKVTGGTKGAFVRMLASKGGYSNIIGEIGEERLGTILRALTKVDDFGAGKDANVIERLGAGLTQDLRGLGVEAVVLSTPTAGIYSLSRIKALQIPTEQPKAPYGPDERLKTLKVPGTVVGVTPQEMAEEPRETGVTQEQRPRHFTLSGEEVSPQPEVGIVKHYKSVQEQAERKGLGFIPLAASAPGDKAHTQAELEDRIAEDVARLDREYQEIVRPTTEGPIKAAGREKQGVKPQTGIIGPETTKAAEIKPEAKLSLAEQAGQSSTEDLQRMKEFFETRLKAKRLNADDRKRWNAINTELRKRHRAQPKWAEMSDEKWLEQTRFYRSGKTKNAELPDGRRVILKQESTKSNFREVSRDFLLSAKPAPEAKPAEAGRKRATRGLGEQYVTDGKHFVKRSSLSYRTAKNYPYAVGKALSSKHAKLIWSEDIQSDKQILIDDWGMSKEQVEKMSEIEVKEVIKRAPAAKPEARQPWEMTKEEYKKILSLYTPLKATEKGQPEGLTASYRSIEEKYNNYLPSKQEKNKIIKYIQNRLRRQGWETDKKDHTAIAYKVQDLIPVYGRIDNWSKSGSAYLYTPFGKIRISNHEATLYSDDMEIRTDESSSIRQQIDHILDKIATEASRIDIIQQALKENKHVPRAVLEEYKSEKWTQRALARLGQKRPKGRPGFVDVTPVMKAHKTFMNVLEPAKAVETKHGKETYAAVVKAVHETDVGRLKFNQTQLAGHDKNIEQLGEWFNKFPDKDLKNFMAARGRPSSVEADLVKRDAMNRLPKELQNSRLFNAVQQIADFNYKYLREVAGDDITRVADYFYGIYKEPKKVEKFLQHWKTTKRFLKEKKIPTVADAIAYGLELRNYNPIENLKAEYVAIAHLHGMQWLKDELMRTGQGKFIDDFPDAPAEWEIVNDPVFSGLRVEPDLAALINSLIEKNKITTPGAMGRYEGVRKTANALRNANNFLRTLKFIGSGFHLLSVAKQSVADSGYLGFLYKKTATRGFTRGFRKYDPIFRTEAYRDYIRHGGGHRYSVESEARRAFAQAVNQLNKNMGKAVKYGALPMRIPTSFVNWMFNSYIPKVKYSKYLDNVAEREKKLGRTLKSGEKIDIIKEQQNFYGMMNERLFGRSGTVTTLLRFYFLAPGYAEGNYRTMLKAATQWGRKGGYNATRSRSNIINSWLITGTLATVGTMIMTGKPPKKPETLDDVRDLFKIDTGKLDNKGRRIMIDMMTYDKDYYQVAFDTLRLRPDKALEYSIKRIGGMKAPSADMISDLVSVSMGKALYDWKGDRVVELTDPFLAKVMKITAHEVRKIEPIPMSVYKQSRRKGIDRTIAAAETLLGYRPTTSEADKREKQLLAKMYSLRGQREEMSWWLSKSNNPEKLIARYNRTVNDILESPHVPEVVKKEWAPKLLIDPERAKTWKRYPVKHLSDDELKKAYNNTLLKRDSRTTGRSAGEPKKGYEERSREVEAELERRGLTVSKSRKKRQLRARREKRLLRQ